MTRSPWKPDALLYPCLLPMQVYYCPIDTSLSFSQANILIRDLKPSHLVVAESYMSPPPLAPQRTDLVIEWVRRCFHFLLFIVYMHFPKSGRGSGNSCFPVQNSDLGFHGQTEDIQYTIQCNFISKCQYTDFTGNVLWCQVHSSHIPSNHKTFNYNNSK